MSMTTAPVRTGLASQNQSSVSRYSVSLLRSAKSSACFALPTVTLICVS